MEVSSYALWAALLMLAEVALAKDYYKVIYQFRIELLLTLELCFSTLQTILKVARHKRIYLY